MESILAYLRDFNLVTVCIRLLLALLLGGVIGYDRERRGRAAGLRTHIIVCLGAAMTALTGLYVSDALLYQTDPTRIAAQVISGIGFLGVGTILVTGRTHVRGLTTAAGLWSTAAVGLSLGFGFYEGALVCVLLLVLTFAYLHRIDPLFFSLRTLEMDLYFEVEDASHITRVIDQIHDFGLSTLHVEVCHAQSAIPGHVGIKATLQTQKDVEEAAIVHQIDSIEGISFVVETT